MRDLFPKIEHLSWVYALPVLSLFFCLILVFIWTYSSKRNSDYEEARRLPLSED